MTFHQTVNDMNKAMIMLCFGERTARPECVS